ncbi:MAG: CmcJ/NvfI family oxidoreductase, partial [Croceibacterium sp.]
MGAEGNVRAAIGYTERTDRKPFFYANAHEKDYVPLKPAEVEIADARGLATDLDREGFVLVQHKSAVEDLTDLDAVAKVHAGEIAELLKRVTGCDHVNMFSRGILRFSERLGENEKHDNSHPARFAHVDMSKEAAAQARAKGAPEGKKVVRSAQYNVWRAISGAPQ